MSMLLLPGKISKKYKVIKSLKQHPRIIEGLIGGGAGGGIGAAYGATDEDNKDKKKVLKGALKGVAIGAAGAIGANQLLLHSARAQDAAVNKVRNEIRRVGTQNADTVFNVPSGIAKDKMYEVVKGHKESIDRLIKSMQDAKQRGNAARVRNYRSFIKGDGKMYKIDLGRVKDDVAVQHANARAKQNYIDKFVNTPDADNYTPNKRKIFGGLRANSDAAKDALKTQQSAMEHDSLIRGLAMDQKIHNMLGFLRPTNDMVHASWYKHPEIGVSLDDIKKTPEFRKTIKNVRRTAYEDFKNNRTSDFFDDAVKGAGKRNISDWGKMNSIMGTDLRHIKTKKEFNDLYRKLSKQYHPDLNKHPDAAKRFSDISTAVDELKKSTWFEKLSGEEPAFEKIAQCEFYKIIEGL